MKQQRITNCFMPYIIGHWIDKPVPVTKPCTPKKQQKIDQYFKRDTKANKIKMSKPYKIGRRNSMHVSDKNIVVKQL